MSGKMTTDDEKHLRRALELAREGVALTSPNPCVGAVVLDANGNVAGEGTHTYADKKHAEVIALEKAGEKARGGTLYLNLEPCCSAGRTGPCTDAIIKSGIKRVVAAMEDPNPNVSGKGFARLRDAGIEVMVAEGALRDEARKLNEAFAQYIQSRRPFVTLKTAMTLDGKIAPPPQEEGSFSSSDHGPSGGWITSNDARTHVQHLRHASDAIMVGVNTVLADDPLLTDRTGKRRRRPLLRIIIDSRLRLPLDSRIVKTAKDDVLVFFAMADEKRRQELEDRGIRVEQLPLYHFEDLNVVGARPIKSATGRPDMWKLVKRLGQMEIISLLIEGGALINWAALAAGIVDKVWLYYAPKILGGTGAVPFASGEGFLRMDEAARVHSLTFHRFAEDFAVEGYLHDPYAPHPPLAAESLGPQLVEKD
jgi:diaminohydroxyphosphoribosylaminopyrimidine deaminase / 5-amino-6-(5-phosphoribosylamino)uracil reductase